MDSPVSADAAIAGSHATSDPSNVALDVSIVMPCLNEAETVAACVAKAVRAIREAGVRGEVIVADNGSTDGSAEIARAGGAIVVHVEARGYGSALMAGIEAARGRYVIMADADESYDLAEAPKFISALQRGYSFVQGCRLPSGGGTVMPNAMPPLHRWIGNPLLTYLARRWFRAPVHDVYCGMRGFSVEAYRRLQLRCTGMEFATEMMIKASLQGERIAEVPITLHPDGRILRSPHLRTFRDGWRTLRLFLLFSPRWLFLVPGSILITSGAVGYALALAGVTIGRATFDVHTLLYASLALIAAQQAISFAVFTKTFASVEGILPMDPWTARILRVMTLERGLLVGGLAVLVGTGLLLDVLFEWSRLDFGRLDYASTMRRAIPGATLVALGLHAMLASFFVAVLGLRRR